MYSNTADWWAENCHLSSRKLSGLHGGDDANWRKRIRAAKDEYPHLFGADKTLRGIAVFDLHYPSHDKRLWGNVLRFADDFAPDVWLFGGDDLDCEPLSHWVGDKKRKVEGKRMKRDYEGFNAEVLAPLSEVLPDHCRRIKLTGNHEDWIEQYIDEHPEVEGFLEMERNLDLDGWEVIEYGKAAVIGKLYAIHGDYCNQHHAMKTVQVYGRNVMYGHTHTYQAHTKITPLDDDAHNSVNIPCACHMNPHYARNKPNAWLSGFGVFYVRPDGSFNLYPVIAVDGHFTAPDGTTY